MPKYKRRLKVKYYIILIIVFLLIIIIGFVNIINWKKDGTELNALENEIKESIDIIENNGMGDNVEIITIPAKETDYQYYINLPFMEVDFTKLLKINNDTIGFIKVNGTNINYPIVYSGDNEYYLTHAFDKSYNKAGWVFMDYRNNLDELSDNTVIYGHGRVDGTVFGTLKKVLTKNWQKNKDNYIVQLSSLNYNYVFEIFSVYVVDKESYYVTTDFQNINEKEIWVSTIKGRDEGNINVDVSKDDYILTLSTCHVQGEKRIVAHAKLIKKENRLD